MVSHGKQLSCDTSTFSFASSWHCRRCSTFALASYQHIAKSMACHMAFLVQNSTNKIPSLNIMAVERWSHDAAMVPCKFKNCCGVLRYFCTFQNIDRASRITKCRAQSIMSMHAITLRIRKIDKLCSLVPKTVYLEKGLIRLILHAPA